MNSREGTVINVSRAEFVAGPKRPKAKTELAHQAIGSLTYLFEEQIEEHDAEVTLIPTGYTVSPEFDEFIDEMIHFDIISAINGQLEKDQHHVDAHELWADAKELREQGCSNEDILEYVLAYLEHFFPELHAKAMRALSIIEAREALVDLVEFSYEHSIETL